MPARRPPVEFVSYDEALNLLRQHRIEEAPQGEARLHLRLMDDDDVVQLHLAGRDCSTAPVRGANRVAVEKIELGGVVEQILHKLNVSEALLIPVGKWRMVFDAVAFSLASNADWQEIDAVAAVQLHTRDPLMCGPVDFHTVRALLDALFKDAETPEQGLSIITTAVPILIEVVPEGAVRIGVASAVLADEIVELVGSARS
jgi:hypothetical protein